MIIQFKRVDNTTQQTVLPDDGQPVWNIDSNSLFIGDGVNVGGLPALMGVATFTGVPAHTHVVNQIVDIRGILLPFLTNVDSPSAAQSYFTIAPLSHIHSFGDLGGATTLSTLFALSGIDDVTSRSILNISALLHTHNIADVLVYEPSTSSYGPSQVYAQNVLTNTTAASAREFIGLGDSAPRNVGTSAGTVAAGDHTHVYTDIMLPAMAGKSGSWTNGNIPIADANGDLTDSGVNFAQVTGPKSVLNSSAVIILNTAPYTISSANNHQTIYLNTSSLVGPTSAFLPPPPPSSHPNTAFTVVHDGVSPFSVDLYSGTDRINRLSRADATCVNSAINQWTVVSTVRNFLVSTTNAQSFSPAVQTQGRDNISAQATISATNVNSVLLGSTVAFTPISAINLPDYQAEDFGTAEDGNTTLDGTTTPSWATRSGSVYTQQRSVALNNLTVNSGVTLYTNGWRINVNGVLTFVSASSLILSVNNTVGANASGATGGATGVTPTGNDIGDTPVPGTNGATGVVGVGITASSVSTAANNIAGGVGLSPATNASGGNGGNGTSGAGGAVTNTTAINGRRPMPSIYAVLNESSHGTRTGGLPGAGGSSGAGSGAVAGGGGGGAGSGAGVIDVSARSITGPGFISSNGANGGNGGNGLGTNAGGGGGGGGGYGGLIRLKYAVSNGNTNITANGGNGGAPGNSGGGTGTAGTAGTAGKFGRIVLFNTVNKTISVLGTGTPVQTLTTTI